MKSPFFFDKSQKYPTSPAEHHPEQGLFVQDAMHGIDSDGANAGGYGIGQPPGFALGKATGNDGELTPKLIGAVDQVF